MRWRRVVAAIACYRPRRSRKSRARPLERLLGLRPTNRQAIGATRDVVREVTRDPNWSVL